MFNLMSNYDSYWLAFVVVRDFYAKSFVGSNPDWMAYWPWSYNEYDKNLGGSEVFIIDHCSYGNWLEFFTRDTHGDNLSALVPRLYYRNIKIREDLLLI